MLEPDQMGRQMVEDYGASTGELDTHRHEFLCFAGGVDTFQELSVAIIVWGDRQQIILGGKLTDSLGDSHH